MSSLPSTSPVTQALALALSMAAALVLPTASRADEPGAGPAPIPATAAAPSSGPATATDFLPSGWASAALFVGGAATAFVAHESCHVLANLTMGVVPKIEPVKFMGAIPFFSISPPVACDGSGCTKDGGARFSPGRPGLYAIYTAGLQCQQLANEIILSTEPQLLHREAPFRKGVLAFNIVLALGYAFADWAGVEPGAGDVTSAERLTGVPRGAIAVAVFVPAVLDMVRYFFPDSRWLPWASRLSKGAIFGFLFAF